MDPDARKLADAIREHARELGLLKCGFVRPGPSAAGARLSEWLARGYHGQMEYLRRRADERRDPRRLFAGLAGAVVCSETYAGPGDVFAELADPSRAHFARYARGEDYHERLRGRLEALCAFIHRAAPGTRTRAYVDTGPLLEKDLAHRAGLGWPGKHTNLVDPTGGNWTCLGVILTDLELPEDAPVPDRCGTCARCLDACPTGAFPAPYVLDARRCISYLTIELKGPIPRPLRPLIGNRVFGCDDCLAVCPWNRFAKEAEDIAYAGRAITAGAPLTELMGLTRHAFNRHFKDTPVHRTKRRGLLRNVAVALGNRGSEEALPVLTAALCDEEGLVRGHAAWAVGEIARKTGADVRVTLEKARADEADPWVREEIARAIG